MARRKKGTGKSEKGSKAEHPGIQSLDSFLKVTEDKMLGTVIQDLSRTETVMPQAPPSGPEILRSIKAPIGTKRISSEGVDISPNEARTFLNELRATINRLGSLGIYFHNDMDGLNAAIFIKRIALSWFGPELEVLTSPLEYEDLVNLELQSDIAYVFCDMDPGPVGNDFFRIDHHHNERNHKEINRRLFLLSPATNDYDYPSTTTILASYLRYVSDGGSLTFFHYLSEGPWHEDDFQRMMVLLSSVCDNLWHLNFMIDIPLKRWIPDRDEEKNLILISISASLILGDEQRSKVIYREFFGSDLDIRQYLDLICKDLEGAKNLFDFVTTISEKAERFYNSVFFGLTDSLDRTIRSIDRDKDILKKLDASMPIELRGNREKMMELLKTKGDLGDQHWRRIKFYGKEMEKLEAKIKVDESSLLKLRAAKRMISTEKGPKLSLFLPRQRSRQIKGIIASLLYYRGWKNIVIEDRAGHASFGARGFTEDEVRSYLSTLAMGFEDLKDYLNLEKVFADLPDIFKRNTSLGSAMTFDKTYSGGIGGRGLIYGGTLKGKVPWVFSLLEESGDVEQKIKELIQHKELGKALQGLTEGQSVVPTSQALRAKFKYTGWLVVHPFGEKEEASIQHGNFNMIIMSLVGFSDMFRVQLRSIQIPQPPMEHSRFDIG